MTDIELNPQGEVVLNVDKSIYNESTIDKVLYWWAGDYIITRRNTPGTTVQTIIISASNPITQEAFHKIRKKLSADFVDYKNRAIIASKPETCGIFFTPRLSPTAMTLSNSNSKIDDVLPRAVPVSCFPQSRVADQ